MKLKDRLRQSLAKRPDRVVLRQEFAHLGSSATQLSQALLDLQKDGVLQRLGEGVYAKSSPAFLSSAEEIESVASEAFRKLRIPVLRSAVKQGEIEAYVPSGSRHRRHLMIGGLPVHIKSTGPNDLVGLPNDVRYLPTKQVADFVRQLANAHHVTYQRSRLEGWAEAVTRAAGDNVSTDDTDGLLIRLKQRKILNAQQFTRLLINHRRELMNV